MLIAIGAILAIAVDYQVQGIDINAIGVVLMVVGGIGLLVSLLFLASFAPFAPDRHSTGVHTDGHSHDHS
jgi:hypothetical protein